jgi:hypothetical protein
MMEWNTISTRVPCRKAAADENQLREIKLSASPSDPCYHGDFHDTVRAKVQDPAERGRHREFASNRAVNNVEKRACSKQQNSNDREAAGEDESCDKARPNAQDGRVVGAESEAKKPSRERELHASRRARSPENCVQHLALWASLNRLA